MTVRKPPIVVGIDGSAPAERAVRWAAREASLSGVSLRLVSAYAWAELNRLPGVHTEDLIVQDACEYLERARRQVNRVAPEVEVATEFVTRHPVDVLTELSRSADQLVLGNRGLGGVAGLLLGSVGVGLAGHSWCPVVVVRGGDTGDTRTAGPVVVGVDGSAHDDAVLAFAYRHAALHRAPMLVVTAWADTAQVPTAARYLEGEAILGAERRRLSGRIAGWAARYPDVVARTEVVRDRPARALMAASKAARLVVVGSRGRGGVAGVLLGSTSQALIHRAECPAAVVRT